MNRRNNRFLIGASALALTALPGIAAAQTAEQPAASVPEATQDTEIDPNEIIVSGFRRSLETAQAIKKDSDDIVDSLVAEDIGKLPDSTGAESLARITGVQVDRLNGEAGGVRLRGLPDITTTYNGREIFTAEGRNVALQDFPAASVSRFDVFKTAGANLVEAGIAGEIDVKSNKPFNFKGSRIVGGITGLHWRQSQEFGIDANLLISNRWETGIGEIGLLVEGSYTDNKFVDSYRDNNTQILRHAANVVVGGVANYPNVRYPTRVSFQYPSSNRFRPSASAALQWRPSQSLEFYADFLFQGFRAAGESSALHFDTGSNAPLYDVTMCEGSTDLVCQMTMRGAGNGITGYQVAQWNKTDTYQGGTGFIWKVPGGGRITGDVALTDSRNWNRNMQFNIFTNSLGTRVFNFDDRSGGGGASAYVTDINLADPASWRMLNFAENGADNHGRSFQGRLDADLPIDFAIFDRLQAGVRYSNRDADSYNDPAENRTPTLGATDPRIQYVNLPLDFEMSMIGFRGDPTTHPRTWITPTRQSIIHNADYLRMLVGQPAGYPKLDWVYSANEKAYAAYLQTHYKFPIGSMELDGQLGLRVVRTTNDISGTLKIGSGAGTPYAKTNEYLDYLPNVSARLKLSRTLQARMSFTKTRTRPGFGSLNPTLTVNATLACDNSVTPPVCNYRTASGGNPDLQPVESTNYDASLEYYFSRSGSATVQVFRRDIIGFINNATVFLNDPELGPLRVDRPENGQKGYIQGIEAGFRTFFKIPSLPQWMQNFGVLANYTYLDHGSELSPSAAATLPGIQPLSGVSSHLANAQFFYDSKPLSLRLSYNYRSSFQTYGVVTDPAVTTQLTLPTVEKGRGTLDFSGSLNPTDNVSLNFSIANLLGSQQRTYRAFNAKGDTYAAQVRYLETVYRMGVRFRF
ncbi:TonB-dependent receptor [Sphingomonas kyeonggiensis]|uniref:TonB-dependent receptor n=1 Tax=Sphingomonas kyeonggiensis TaxID=1268553 RepID=A0A7W7K2N8_9SPHN|nr:TonB-dependent receptor [Sphingomonas kyeonggiensis]MBB4839607.1 TonB-dependent receptor [Sphingomonas kyeonggiensis]